MLRESLSLRAAAIASALFVAGTAGAVAAPEIGEPAPGFTGTDSKGNPVSLADFAGQTVVLEWTNDGCPYVQMHYGTGNMQALQHETTDAGIVWLSIISSAPGTQGHAEGARAEALTAERDAAPTAVLLDPAGEIGRLYEAKTTPHMYIVDGAGVLRYMGGIDDRPTARWQGVESAHNLVRAALDDLAAGKPVATPVSRPYGCTVKYGPSA